MKNASILSVDAGGLRLRLQVGGARPPSVALSDLPRGEHRSSAVPRAASTSMQLSDSRRAPAFDVDALFGVADLIIELAANALPCTDNASPNVFTADCGRPERELG